MGVGGGLNVAYSDGTLEVTGRVGVGYGIGASYDPNGMPSPHAESCGSGLVARTTANVSAGAGFGNVGVGGSFTGSSGNAFTTSYGGGFTTASPEIIGGPGTGLGARVGATIGVEVGSYTNW